MSEILQKIRRNEKKCEKIKSKIFFQKSKTGNVLGRSLRLCKKFWWVLVHSLNQNNLEGILGQFWANFKTLHKTRRIILVQNWTKNWTKMPSKLF